MCVTMVTSTSCYWEWIRDEREKELIEIINNILYNVKTSSKKEL